MSKRKLIVKDVVTGALVALFILATPPYVKYVFSTEENHQPYHSVRLLKEELLENGDITVKFAFIKTDHCDFERLGVFGESLGYWEPLPHTLPRGERGHRIAGKQTLVVTIHRGGHRGGLRFTGIEIRTQHSCSGKRVSKVFWEFK